MTQTELLRDIEKGKILPVYLFCGNEKYLMEEALRKVETFLVEPATRPFNYNLFQYPDIAADAIIDVAQTMPMMARKRLVVVKDIDKLASSEMEKLVRYIKDPSPPTCLILIGEKVDMRKGFFQALKDYTVQFDPIPESRVPLWLKKEAESKGKRITDEAAQYLVEVVGNDLLRLRNEVEKALLYAGDRKEIGLADVEAVSTRCNLKSIFDLTDSVGMKNMGKALRVLGELLNKGENGVYILHMIVRQFRQIWKVRELIDAGKKPDVIGRELGMQPFILKKLMEQAKRFSSQDLREAFLEIIEADTSLKSSRLTDRMVLHALFMKLLSAGPKIP